MPGQAIVTIRDKEWNVAIASTLSELASGLSGLASIPNGNGMLFDLGADYQFIPIDMSRMLFPLDIIFISSQEGVVSIFKEVDPGENISFEAMSSPVRYFLEVNTGEAEGIEIGDSVSIQGDIQSGDIYPAFWTAIAAAVAAGLAGALASNVVLKGNKSR